MSNYGLETYGFFDYCCHVICEKRCAMVDIT
jgi:hypothetical protein